MELLEGTRKGKMGKPRFRSHGSFRRCRHRQPPGEGMSLWEGGDLVPFVVVVKHTAVDATDCCQALPVIHVDAWTLQYEGHFTCL